MQYFEIIRGRVNQIEHDAFEITHNGVYYLYRCAAHVPVLEIGDYLSCAAVDGMLVRVRNHTSGLITTYQTAFHHVYSLKEFGWAMSAGFCALCVGLTGGLEVGLTLAVLAQSGTWFVMMLQNMISAGHNSGLSNEVDRLLDIKQRSVK